MASILSKPDQILKKSLESMGEKVEGVPGVPNRKLGKIVIKAESPADGNNDLELEVEASIKSL